MKHPRIVHWEEMTSPQFKAIDAEQVIAVLPIAAIEQHGPHLPVGTDTLIARGMIAQTITQLPDDLAPLFLPVQAIGKSNEHLRFPGTLSLTGQRAIEMWTAIGDDVHRAGIRKLMIVNSHGGNADLMGIIARDLRARLDMLVVSSAWLRLGYPEGVFTQREIAHGIHAGDVETSLMLHFHPELVRAGLIEDFKPTTLDDERDYDILSATGRTAYAWIASDLNASGAVGDARLATAEKGRLTAQHQAGRFVELLREVTRFPLARLASVEPANARTRPKS